MNTLKLPDMYLLIVVLLKCLLLYKFRIVSTLSEATEYNNGYFYNYVKIKIALILSTFKYLPDSRYPVSLQVLLSKC